MKRENTEKTGERKRRSDAGGRHRAYTYDGRRVEMLNFAGVVEVEFGSLREAAFDNGIGASYQGILACCNGKTRKHCGKVWRWKEVSDEED